MLLKVLFLFAVVTGCRSQTSCITQSNIKDCASQLIDLIPALENEPATSLEQEMMKYFDVICGNPVPLQEYYKCVTRKTRSCLSEERMKLLPTLDNLLKSITFLCDNITDVDLDCYSSTFPSILRCTEAAMSKGTKPDVSTVAGYTEFMCRARREATSCYRTKLSVCPKKTAPIMTEYYQYQKPPACSSTMLRVSMSLVVISLCFIGLKNIF